MLIFWTPHYELHRRPEPLVAQGDTAPAIQAGDIGCAFCRLPLDSGAHKLAQYRLADVAWQYVIAAMSTTAHWCRETRRRSVCRQTPRINQGWLRGVSTTKSRRRAFARCSDSNRSWRSSRRERYIPIHSMISGSSRTVDSLGRHGLGVLAPVVLILGYWSLGVSVFNLIPWRGLDGTVAWRIIPLSHKQPSARRINPRSDSAESRRPVI